MNGGGSNIVGIIALSVSGLSLAFSIFFNFSHKKLKQEMERLRDQAAENLKKAEELYESARRYSALRQKLEKLARRHETIQGKPSA